MLRRAILTAIAAVGSSLFLWVVLVWLLDNRLDGRGDLVWSGTLWLSSMLCSGIVAHSPRAVRPVLACTTAFAVFALIYVAAEGLTFGVESEGGDLGKTHLVFWNLVFLPVGVFIATELGVWVRRQGQGRTKPTDIQSPKT